MQFINKIIKLARKNYLKAKKKLSPRIEFLNKKRKIYYKKIITHARRKPISTFLGLLLMLLGLIIISNVINRPKEAMKETAFPIKEVQVYTVGTSPKISVQAQIEKSGVIKIVSLGGGVVQGINVEVGQQVSRGQNLVSLSSNYQGGNGPSIQRQLAQIQYRNVLDTYSVSKELINKQKELAEKNDKNSDELRKISNDSLDSSRNLINLNNDILSVLEANQTDAEAAGDDVLVLSLKQLRTQFIAGNNQLSLALKNAEYSGSDSNPPAHISDISKDITLKQLEIQEKALNLNKEIFRLSLALAQVNEAIMFPSAPIQGVVDRIYVKIGQAVNPGTPLVQISGDSSSLIAVALISRELADSVSTAQVSTLHFGDESYEEVPFYVSKEATDGTFYTVQFQIPSEFSSQVTDKGYITIEIPIDYPKTGSTIPFVPIDSIFQTQDQAFLFVASEGKALSRKVSLGQVIGRFVEIKKGLKDQDQVILNRNVISNDRIRITK